MEIDLQVLSALDVGSDGEWRRSDSSSQAQDEIRRIAG